MPCAPAIKPPDMMALTVSAPFLTIQAWSCRRLSYSLVCLLGKTALCGKRRRQVPFRAYNQTQDIVFAAVVHLYQVREDCTQMPVSAHGAQLAAVKHECCWWQGMHERYWSAKQ